MSYCTGAEFNHKGKYTLAEALRKTYLIKSVSDSRGHIKAYVSLPSCLIGKRVKLVLIKEEKK